MQSLFHDIHFAYQLHFHFGFRTHYRKPLLVQPEVHGTIRRLLDTICQENGYHLLEHEVEPLFVRALLSLRPEHVPSEVAQRLKGVLSRRLKQEHPAAFGSVSEGKLWSEGYFCRTVGKARRDVVERYIAGQPEHHGYTSEALRRMRYRFEDSPVSPGPVDLCYHVVLETQHHAALFVPEVTDHLAAFLRERVKQEGCVVSRATFLADHVHLSVPAPPKIPPRSVVETIMMSGWQWMTEHCQGGLKLEDAWDVWEQSAYVGTLGEVTTDHVRNYLRVGGA